MRCVAASVAVLALGLGVLVAQGCGGGADGGGGVAGEPGTGSLQITYIPEPGRTPRTATLNCPATTSDQLPRSAGSARWAASRRTGFAVSSAPG